MRGFKFFHKAIDFDRFRWVLASYHSPHSLTWSWYINFTVLREGEPRAWPIFWTRKLVKINGLKAVNCGFRIPFIGTVRYSWQSPMWFRDLYWKLKNHPPIVHITGQPGEKLQPIVRDSAKIIPMNGDRGRMIPPYES